MVGPAVRTRDASSCAVLVVDDNDDVREAVQMLLEARGYRAVGARDGRDALTVLEALVDAPPHVILLDLMMPVMDGRQFRELQQADQRLAAIPVLVISAGSDVGKEAARMRANGYLQKPVHFDELLAAIGKYCCCPDLPEQHDAR